MQNSNAIEASTPAYISQAGAPVHVMPYLVIWLSADAVPMEHSRATNRLEAVRMMRGRSWPRGAHSVAIICPKTLTAEMHSHVQAKAGV